MQGRAARFLAVWLVPVMVALGLLVSGAAACAASGPVRAAALGGQGGDRPVLELPETGPGAPAWPAVQVLHERAGPLTLAQVRARDAEFTTPDAPWANLGTLRHAVWLRIAVRVRFDDELGTGDEASEPSSVRSRASHTHPDDHWVLDIDYAALRQIDVYRVTDGVLMFQQRMGAALKASQQPLPGRVPAMVLDLPPGPVHLLYLRVATNSAHILPISLNRPEAFHARESRRGVVQGLLAGMSATLLAYCLAHGLSMRSALFGLYGGLLTGTTLFFVHLFGIGQQHLWPEHPEIQEVLSPLSVLLALTPGSLFIAQALDTRVHHPRMHRVLLALAACSALFLVLGAADALPYPVVKAAASLLGIPVVGIGAVASYRQARQGNRAAAFMLVGWSAYTVGGVSMVAVLYGLVPATLLTLHAFQACWVIEVLAWMMVLALHVEQVRRRAERSELEKQALASLAHTDALTGLPNRRGLALALARALKDSTPARPLAVYLLDLDGFKPVNDRLGHDAGDELLVQVAARLRQQLRAHDVVARLGGDEFVVLARHLGCEADALAVGHKLLRAFEVPFTVQQQVCQVGLTIGLALAPHDGADAAALLKVADAAMYAGKAAGRHCLRRGSVPARLVSA